MSVAFGTIASNSTTWSEVNTGTVLLWTGLYTSIPTGFLICNGAAVSDTTYADLLAVTGTRYGAGGAGTFNVPNMIDKFPAGASTSASGGSSGGGGSHDHCLKNIGTTTCGSHSHCIRCASCSCYLRASSFYKNGAYNAACCGTHCHCIKVMTSSCGTHSHSLQTITCCATALPPFITFVFIIKT